MAAYTEIIIGALLVLIGALGTYMVKDGFDNLKKEKVIIESISKAESIYNKKLYSDALKEYELIRNQISQKSNKHYGFVNLRIGFCELELSKTKNENKEESILKAIHALEESLSYISKKEKYQSNHLQSICNLGSAYIDISNFRNSENYLTKAIEVLGSVELNKIDKNVFSEEYASILINIATAHLKYAEIKDRGQHLLKAKEKFELVIKENSQKDKFLRSMTMNNYGGVLYKLFMISENNNYAEESENAFQNALKYLTLEEFPYEYALIQNNIGLLYASLAKKENQKNYVIKALDSYKESLKVRSREKYTYEYSSTQNNIGDALLWQALIAKPASKKILLESKKYFEEAIRTISIESNPIDYAIYSHNLASVYLGLSDIENKEENIRHSISANENALKVLSKDKYPEKYNIIKRDIDIAYRK